MVLVSGSCVDILAPIAADLSIRSVLATRLEVIDGRYTGKILPPQIIGAGKALVVEDVMKRHGARPGDAFAYGDHESDESMLASVGHPVVVSRDPHMLGRAGRCGWQTLDPDADPFAG